MSLHGKATRRKADDLFGAFLCYKHHKEYDQYASKYSTEWYFMRAMGITQRRLLDMGIIK